MDFQRIILIAALSLTLFLMWSAWQRDYGPKPPVPTEATSTQAKAPEVSKDVPTAPPPISAPAAETPVAKAPSGKRIHVVTDLFNADIDSIGGDLRRLDLLKYPVAVDKQNQPTRLLDDGPSDYFIAQAALLPSGDNVAPRHTDEFKPEAAEYQMKSGEDTLRVPLHWSNGSGLEVTKTYIFHRGSYVIGVDLQVKNGTDKAWQGTAYRQLQRSNPGTGNRLTNRAYTGGAISTDEKNYSKISFKEIDKESLSLDTKQAWVAMIQHYFIGAWIPGVQGTHHLYTKALGDNRYMIGMYDPAITIEPGKEALIPAKLYVGPKLPDAMAAAAPNLERTVDYGLLTVLAKPLFWLLNHIHDLVKNWGLSIILLTVLIKLLFYKLSETQYKSMAHMREMQPKMAALKERYGDDKQKYQEAMMKFYREEKINPLGGCLPIVVQIPVFMALYFMLLENVELRQAPFIFWIKDLSIADPYYVLPVIMGITMIIQHRLNPTPLDPVQARVMMVLPFVFTFFFVFFPAGLVIYWVVNNTLSIAQQWYITRRLELSKKA